MSAIGAVLGRYFEVRAIVARTLNGRHVPVEDAARELAKNGVVVLQGRIPSNVTESLNRANSQFFGRSVPEELAYSPDGKALLEVAGARPSDIDRFYFLHIKKYQEKVDVYGSFVAHIDSILASYYQSNYYVRDVYCYRTQPIEHVSGSYQWHVDNYPAGSLKVITYLTDVGMEGGPLAVAGGSHASFRERLGEIGARFEDAYVRARHPILECYGSAGTVIIFNNNAIHRAVDPRTGVRDVVNFTVFPCVFGKRPTVRGLDLNEEAAFLKKYTR